MTPVAAGVPIEAIKDVESFNLTDAFDPREHFLLRVKGHSMILDGITMVTSRPSVSRRQQRTATPWWQSSTVMKQP